MTTREELADEITGFNIGSGYYGLTIDYGEALEIADIVLAHLEAEAAAKAKELAVVHSPNCCALLPFERLECCCQPGMEQ